MLSSQSPAKIQIPFARDGAKRAIPITSQIGIVPGAASFPDGFVPLNLTAIEAGGIAPSGLDFNGLFNAITSVQQWQSSGGLFSYDATLSSAIGGYPKGAFLLKSDFSGFWFSTIESNTSNPDTGGAGWISFLSSSDTGKLSYFARSSPPSGYISANGGTIGAPASGATNRANIDTFALYSLLWSEFDNTQLIIQTSAGASTTRGASAAIDFAANKRLPTIDARAEVVRGLDDGRGVDSGRALGSGQLGQIEEHQHYIYDHNAGSDPVLPSGVGSYDFGMDARPYVSPASGYPALKSGFAGGNETRMRNIALLACWKL